MKIVLQYILFVDQYGFTIYQYIIPLLFPLFYSAEYWRTHIPEIPTGSWLVYGVFFSSTISNESNVRGRHICGRGCRNGRNLVLRALVE